MFSLTIRHQWGSGPPLNISPERRDGKQWKSWACSCMWVYEPPLWQLHKACCRWSNLGSSDQKAGVLIWKKSFSWTGTLHGDYCLIWLQILILYVFGLQVQGFSNSIIVTVCRLYTPTNFICVCICLSDSLLWLISRLLWVRFWSNLVKMLELQSDLLY